MSRRIADLLIKIGADSYEFQQKAKSVEKSLGSMEKRLSSLGKSLSLKLTAPLTALGAVAIKNADTQVQAEARLLTALDGRAEVQERLLRQASEIQSRTVIGDENFTVLYGIHGAGVNVEIRVELLHRHLISSCL